MTFEMECLIILGPVAIWYVVPLILQFYNSCTAFIHEEPTIKNQIMEYLYIDDDEAAQDHCVGGILIGIACAIGVVLYVYVPVLSMLTIGGSVSLYTLLYIARAIVRIRKKLKVLDDKFVEHVESKELHNEV